MDDLIERLSYTRDVVFQRVGRRREVCSTLQSYLLFRTFIGWLSARRYPGGREYARLGSPSNDRGCTSTIRGLFRIWLTF